MKTNPDKFWDDMVKTPGNAKTQKWPKCFKWINKLTFKFLYQIIIHTELTTLSVLKKCITWLQKKTWGSKQLVNNVFLLVSVCFYKGAQWAHKFTKKTEEPDSVQLRRECEVQHLLGVNTLKSRAVNEVPTGPLTSSKSCLASASVVRLQAGQQIPKARPTYAQEKAGPAEPVTHKLPVRLKRYINCEMQTGTLWHHIPASTYLCARSCAVFVSRV